MARKTNLFHRSERLSALVSAATRVFCRCGYERTQMADVAREMGVSTGAVYQYVEGKEALFDLVVRANAGGELKALCDVPLPVKTPAPGATLEFLRSALNRPHQWPRLEAALEETEPRDARRELEGILREQYRLMREYRYGLVLLTRSALEFPGLLEVFVLGLRQLLMKQLAQYLESRCQAGLIAPQADWPAAAAMLVQTMAWANHQRPFDPGLSHFPEDLMENTVISILTQGLLAPPRPLP
jgi:AcrR family transcriptional regulator